MKNIKKYTDSGEFQESEGIKLSSSKAELLKILVGFEGKEVEKVQIKNASAPEATNSGKKMQFGRFITLLIPISRQIDPIKYGDYKSEQILSPTEYQFNILTEWQLHHGDKLIYDDANFTQDKSLKTYKDKLQKLKITKIEMGSKWDKLSISFNDNLKLVAISKGGVRPRFFTITKKDEPFRMVMDFARPESIEYHNESVQSKVIARKDRPSYTV